MISGSKACGHRSRTTQGELRARAARRRAEGQALAQRGHSSRAGRQEMLSLKGLFRRALVPQQTAWKLPVGLPLSQDPAAMGRSVSAAERWPPGHLLLACGLQGWTAGPQPPLHIQQFLGLCGRYPEAVCRGLGITWCPSPTE